MNNLDMEIKVETVRELDLGIEVISEVAVRMPFCAATRMPFCSMARMPFCSLKINAKTAQVLLTV